MKHNKRLSHNLGNLLHMRFYNRLMIYNTLCFLVVAYFVAFLATGYASRVNTMKQLQQDRNALSAVCSYYDRKHDEFLNLVFPMYDVKENYNAISRMLESKSDQDYENDPFVKQEIVNVMKGITVRDEDIAAVLIYKSITGARYVYTCSSRTLSMVGPDYAFFKQLKEETPGRSIFGTCTLDSRSSLPIQVYGIEGTLGTWNISHNAGRFIIAYKTDAINDTFQMYSGKIQGRYIIVSYDGDIIFDSNAKYGGGVFPYMKVLMSGADTAVIDGSSCYIQTIQRPNRKYIAAHIVHKEEVDRNNAGMPFLIFGIVTAMAFICAVLYSLAGFFASRHVMELEKAMKRVGLNNLSYRIPIHGRHDEFEEIAIRFNTMCDELQLTIKREYINEIRKKNAELKALQAGINPHFLYNTLEAIRVKAFDDGNNEVAEMIVLLANLYRSIVRDCTFITIRKEISMCNMYLSIFSMRYACKFDYKIDIDSQILEYGIPKNLLQPIVENYFVHGIRDNRENNRFIILGAIQDGNIRFVFEDNGHGMDKNRLEDVRNRLEALKAENESSYGLLNVHERIRLVYGEAYGLQLESTENCRTQFIVNIRAMTCDELENSIKAGM